MLKRRDNYAHGYSSGASRNTWAQLTVVVADVNDEAPEFLEEEVSCDWWRDGHVTSIILSDWCRGTGSVSPSASSSGDTNPSKPSEPLIGWVQSAFSFSDRTSFMALTVLTVSIPQDDPKSANSAIVFGLQQGGAAARLFRLEGAGRGVAR